MKKGILSWLEGIPTDPNCPEGHQQTRLLFLNCYKSLVMEFAPLHTLLTLCNSEDLTVVTA